MTPKQQPTELAAVATQLLGAALCRYGIRPCGVIAEGGWETDSEGIRSFAREGGRILRISHDEREAPVILDGPDALDESLLVSFTDESEVALLAWADRSRGSRVVGLGIDLASLQDFAGERGERFNHLLFTKDEQQLVEDTWADDPTRGYAYAFSAKEAAFKSCAAPLRAWYHSHTEELLFDLRSFELDEWDHEKGTAHRGEAQRAMDLMGVGTIELHRLAWDDMALTLALALKA